MRYNKSPSDTMIYTPAVGRAKHILDGSPTLNINSNSTKTVPNINDRQRSVDPEMINNSLSQLRLIAGSRTDQRRSVPVSSSPKASGSADPKLSEGQGEKQQIKDARNAAERAIIEAEKFKARIQQPNRGKEYHNLNLNINQQGELNADYRPGLKLTSPGKKWYDDELRAMRYIENDDDEFFHTTCHIDDSLKEKIEHGKFVELEKLIQKRILQYNNQSDNRMQLINKDGLSYFVPSIDKETKIDSVKKWEQAFRVYTTIYCKANPNRAGEILQYIDIIHRAAAIFNWDNVAKYDYVFRQLMASKPYRSWAKVYTQMWNLTLNEPIKKFNENGNHMYNNNHRNGQQKRKDTFCWKYNKNNCTYGRNCKFEHKCSYCGVSGHPVTNCHKKLGKKEKQDKGKSHATPSSSH